MIRDRRALTVKIVLTLACVVTPLDRPDAVADLPQAAHEATSSTTTSGRKSPIRIAGWRISTRRT